MVDTHEDNTKIKLSLKQKKRRRRYTFKSINLKTNKLSWNDDGMERNELLFIKYTYNKSISMFHLERTTTMTTTRKRSYEETRKKKSTEN